jgi:hypothetical protein
VQVVAGPVQPEQPYWLLHVVWSVMAEQAVGVPLQLVVPLDQ